jgi:nicotinamide mononucleotide (NMN) deamidase PncC
VPDLLASLAASVAARLMARRETVAVSESSTGGLISAALELLDACIQQAGGTS